MCVAVCVFVCSVNVDVINLKETHTTVAAGSDLQAQEKQTAALPKSISVHEVLQDHFAHVGDKLNPAQLHKSLKFKSKSLLRRGATVTNHDLAVCHFITARLLRPEHRSGNLRHMTSTMVTENAYQYRGVER